MCLQSQGLGMHRCGGRLKGRGREGGAGECRLIFAAVTSWSWCEKSPQSSPAEKYFDIRHLGFS